MDNLKLRAILNDAMCAAERGLGSYSCGCDDLIEIINRAIAAESDRDELKAKLQQLVMYMAMIDKSIEVPEVGDTYDFVIGMALELDKLKSKLAEIEAQEPDFYVDPDGKDFEGYGSLYKSKETDTCIPVWLNAKQAEAAKYDAAQFIPWSKEVEFFKPKQDARLILQRILDEGFTVDTYTEIKTLLAKPNEHREPVANNSEPVFYYRPTSSGGYEGPIHAGSIEKVRVDSGVWKPLYAEQVTPNKAEVPSYIKIGEWNSEFLPASAVQFDCEILRGSFPHGSPVYVSLLPPLKGE